MLILTNGSVNHASDYMCGNSEDQQNLKSSFPKGITGDPFGLLREKNIYSRRPYNHTNIYFTYENTSVTQSKYVQQNMVVCVQLTW